MFCDRCGRRREGKSVFCISCGAPLRNSIVIAKQMSQNIFRNDRKTLFWGYLFGLVAVNLFLSFRAENTIGTLFFIAEILAFVLGFVRAQNNWLTIWKYLIISSLVLGFIEILLIPRALVETQDSVALFIGLVVSALLIKEHNELSRKFGLDPWSLNMSKLHW